MAAHHWVGKAHCRGPAAGSGPEGEGPVISRVGAVHRSLAAMFEETRAAFRDGDEAEAAVAFGRLREELETHFDKEDRLYYPAIRALRPDRAEAVNRVERAHAQFIRRFELIVAQIQEGKLDEDERKAVGQKEGRLVRYCICTEDGPQMLVCEPLLPGVLES